MFFIDRLISKNGTAKSSAVYKFVIFFLCHILLFASNVSAENITYKDYSTGDYYTLEGAIFSHTDVIEYRVFLDSNFVNVYNWYVKDGKMVNPIFYIGPLSKSVIGVLNQTIDVLKRLSGTGSWHNSMGGVFKEANPPANTSDEDERIMISVPNGEQWWWGDGGYDNRYGTYSSFYMKFNVYDYSKRRKATFLETLLN